MALITLPAKFGLSRVKFGLRRGGVTMRSRFTGKRQTVVYPFAMWELEATLIDYPEGDEARAIRSFLVALEGQKNTFDFPVPAWIGSVPNILNNISYEVYGDGNALAGDNNFIFRVGLGYTAGTYFKAGDYFQIGNELKVVTADVNSVGGSDIATVFFQPPLRKTYAHAAVMTVRNPKCRMHAEDDDVATWGLAPPTRHDIKISAVEAIE